jgi:hypothetical protein
MKMKPNYFIHNLILLIILSFTSCEIAPVGLNDEIGLSGLNELKEIIDVNGEILDIESNDDFSPFIYMTWTKGSTPRQIDSIYFLKDDTVSIISAFKIEEEIYNKSKDRGEYLMSNGNYFYVEVDKYANFFVSQQVATEKDLDNDLLVGKYKNIASEIDGW